jgi:hypothetical protein
MPQVKCPKCDHTEEAPDDGFIYTLRHWNTSVKKGHELEKGEKAEESVKDE